MYDGKDFYIFGILGDSVDDSVIVKNELFSLRFSSSGTILPKCGMVLSAETDLTSDWMKRLALTGESQLYTREWPADAYSPSSSILSCPLFDSAQKLLCRDEPSGVGITDPL